MPKLPGLAALHGGALRVVLISRGSVQQNLAKLKGPVTLPILLQPEFEVAEAYDCSSTPAAVLVSADGVIQSLLAVGAPAIEQLIASAVDLNRRASPAPATFTETATPAVHRNHEDEPAEDDPKSSRTV
jgi:hypothetical protein